VRTAPQSNGAIKEGLNFSEQFLRGRRTAAGYPGQLVQMATFGTTGLSWLDVQKSAQPFTSAADQHDFRGRENSESKVGA